MRTFFPVAEASQADYEALREASIAGTVLCDPAARRFSRAGLAGLVYSPITRPGFLALVIGLDRPAWSPYADPRVEALCAGYELLVSSADAGSGLVDVEQRS
jgi:hypothetical protein